MDYLKVRQVKKLLPRSKKIEGEKLSEDSSSKIRWNLRLGYTFLITLPIFYLVTRIGELLARVHFNGHDGAVNLLSAKDLKSLFSFTIKSFWSPFTNHLPWLIYLTLLVCCIGIAFYFSCQLEMWSRPLAQGQKGDNKLSTLKNIKETFTEIPHKETSFKGLGGIPITHYKDKWYIETDTVNTVVVGTSRSGKGQTVVLPTIDILSRAETKSSMVVNDPKTELYVASKDELKKRGYDVYAYNLVDPLQSMSDNPLSLIVKYWQRGDIDTATQLTNTFTNTIYNDPHAGNNKYFNENAQKAVNALVFALLEQADVTGDYTRITPNNLVELLSEIGGFNFDDSDGDDGKIPKKINALDEFMEQLPPGNLAKKQYGATKIGSDKAKGNILSTAITGLNPFTLTKIAKMTSKSTIDYKSVGFPKYIDFKVHESLLNERLTIRFFDGEKRINEERVKVGYKGFCEINFDCRLKNGSTIQIAYSHEGTEYSTWYTFELEKLSENRFKKEAKLTPIKNKTKIKVESIKMHYSDRPVAIFMMTPDQDTSNHVIVSIFLKQLYTELATQCVKTKGDKCHRRIHFLLDEFGNMPAIDGMEGIMTVTAGRNMLWDLFVQSYAQIYGKYGKETGTTIKENCQTHIYIMSTNDDTIEEFSKKVGHRTVNQESGNRDALGRNTQINVSIEQERILTPERVSSLLEGESIVLRSLKRRSKDNVKIRPYPIFNTGETAAIYAYKYLTQFNPEWDINDIDIHCDHAELDLKELQLDYTYFLTSERARQMYEKSQQNNIQKNQKETNKNEEDKSEEEKPSEESQEKLTEEREENVFTTHRRKVAPEYKEHVSPEEELFKESSHFIDTIETDENVKNDLVVALKNKNIKVIKEISKENHLKEADLTKLLDYLANF